MYFVGVTPVGRKNSPQGVYLPMLFSSVFKGRYVDIHLDECAKGVLFSDYIFEKISGLKSDITIILLFPPLVEFDFDFYINLADKKIKIGAYCSDGIQYFNDWFRYLGLALDFFILSEPAEVSEFERYLFKSFWHPLINLTCLPVINDSVEEIENRKKFAIHLGSMKYRSERSNYDIKKFENIGMEFYGPDEGMNFIITNEVPNKLKQFKIGVVFTQSGNRTIRAFDEMLDYSYQLKGKTWDYLFSGCVILTQESPLRINYLPNDCCIIFKNSNDLFEKLKYYASNIEKLETIAKNVKTLSYYYSENFEDNLCNFLKNTVIIDKKNNCAKKIYNNNIYRVIFTIGIHNLLNYTLNRKTKILNSIGLINSIYGIIEFINFEAIRIKKYIKNKLIF